LFREEGHDANSDDDEGRVLCETGRASTSDGLLARLFPSPQATDDEEIVETPVALDRYAFRHVLSFWPPLPHLLGAPPKSSEASYRRRSRADAAPAPAPAADDDDWGSASFGMSQG